MPTNFSVCWLRLLQPSDTGLAPSFPANRGNSIVENMAHPLVQIVAAELHSTVGHYPNAIRAITCHKTLETFFPPHLCERLVYRHLILLPAFVLHLKEDF